MKEKNKYFPWILSGLSLFLLVAGFTLQAFPFLIFVSLTPVFGIYEYSRTYHVPFPNFLGYFLLPFIGSYLLIALIFPENLSSFMAGIHGSLMLISMCLFWVTQTYAKNRIGFFTVVIFWLAMEYSSLQWLHTPAEALLGAALNSQSALLHWSSHTGFLGVSGWILMTNVILYTTLIKRLLNAQKIHWPSFTGGVVLILAPAIISLLLLPAWQSLSLNDVNMYFSGNLDTIRDVVYRENGEYIGRTAFWISLLLICYSMVRKTIAGSGHVVKIL